MLMHRAAGALAIMDDYEFRDALRDRQNELIEEAEEIIDRAEHVEDRTELPHAVQAKYYGSLGRRIFLQHPIGAAMITLHGIEMNLFDSDADAMIIVSRLPVDRADVARCVHAHRISPGDRRPVWGRGGATGRSPRRGATSIYFIVLSAGAESQSVSESR